MSEQSLRAALEKLARECEVEAGIGGTLSYRSLSEDLARLLAAHPAEPALVVTDEAVKKAANVYWETEGNRAVCMRAALEAAAPLLGPQSLLHHGDVYAALEQGYKDGAMGGEWPTLGADAVMDLARPMPTREQIAETLVGVIPDVNEGINLRLVAADAVLALINGGGPEARNREDDLLPHEKGAGLYRGWGAAK